MTQTRTGQAMTDPLGRQYSLEILQQPQRARMCGFGDKDRRPLTPPPIVKLVVMDMHGKRLDIQDIDTSFFVLVADLWSTDASKELNLVVHPSSTSSASSAATAAAAAAAAASAHSSHPHQLPTTHHVQREPSSSYTRNLIGSLVASAFKLNDPQGDAGIFFIFQDLSIRTEGAFRLKFCFADLGTQNRLNTAVSRILTTTFSDPFMVYSAKKFPGMIESTPLSKCFARQGIKIPIRKDGKKQKDDEDD